jgi:hypothetical protein
MAFDNIFKLTMRELLKSCEAKAEKVGTLPLEIDTVVRCKDVHYENHVIPILVNKFSKNNLLEYKSERDAVAVQNLSKLLGYVGLYCDQHSIGINDMRTSVTAWYISARRPAFLDDLLLSKIAAKDCDMGVYNINTGFPCPCRVIVCDELDVNDDNIPLLLLGSVPTIRKGIAQLARAGVELRHDMQTIITSIYLSYYDKVRDMTEMNELLPVDVRRSMKHAIEDLGLDEMIEEIGIDKVKEAIARLEAGKKPAKKTSKKQ